MGTYYSHVYLLTPTLLKFKVWLRFETLWLVQYMIHYGKTTDIGNAVIVVKLHSESGWSRPGAERAVYNNTSYSKSIDLREATHYYNPEIG